MKLKNWFKFREKKLIRYNRILKALGKSSQAIMKAQDEQAFLNEVCRIVVEDCNFPMVWIGFAQNDSQKSVTPVAFAGFDNGYIENLKISWADTERGRGPTGTAIHTCKPVLCNDMLTDPAFLPWRKEAIKRGYASSVVFPLIDNGSAFGAISIYSRIANSFTQEEVDCLKELSSDLTYGILRIRSKSIQEQSEAALRNNEEYLKSLLNSLIEGFCIIEVIFDKENPVDYKFIEVNKTFEELTGLADVTGKSMREIAPDNEDYWYKLYGKVALTGIPAHYTNETKALNRWFDVHAFKIGDQESRKVAICFNNITERKIAEEALKQSEEKYQAIHDNTPIGIMLSNKRDGNIISVNNAFLKIFEITRDEIIGKKSLDLEIIKMSWFKTIYRDIEKQGIIHDRECSGYTKTGNLKHLILNLNYVTISGEQFILSTIKDITERKNAEIDRQRSELQFRLLFENMRQGAVCQDKNGVIISTNPAAEEILGKTKNELIGSTCFLNNLDLFQEDGLPLTSSQQKDFFKACSNEKLNNHVIGFYNLKKNEIRWISIDTISIMRSDENEPQQTYALFNDITQKIIDENEKKIATEKLNQYANHLKEINMMKDKFFWTIAHDLKNPFTVLLLSSEIMLKGNLTSDEIYNISKSIYNSAKNVYQF